jgi:hypothetical protein
MAKEIYISIAITEYGNGNIDCIMAQQIDDEDMTLEWLDFDHACKLMWELKLAGGRKQVRVNQLDRHIVTREVYIFLPN